MKEVVRRWNEEYFDGGLSQECLDILDQIDSGNRELLDFTDTQFYYAHLAGVPPTEFSPLAARFYAFATGSYLLSLWDRIPPITRAGRLKLIDEAAEGILGLLPDSPVEFLDMGCGYPPLTTMETAKVNPQWRCMGIDPGFPRYTLFDDRGTGACVDEHDTLTFIQYPEGDLQPIPAKVAEDKARFAALWQAARADPAKWDDLRQSGHLVTQPLAEYAGGNLTLRRCALMELVTDQRFDLVRCMNVSYYLSGEALLDNMREVKVLLRDAGWFIFGSASDRGSALKYTTYRKQGDRLEPVHFGMDLGKLTIWEGSGWWGFHKDQPDTLFLTRIIRRARRDDALMRALMPLADKLASELGYSTRCQDGYLRQTGFVNVSKDYPTFNRELAEACGDRVQRFFSESGFAANVTPDGYLILDLSRSDPALYQEYLPVL
jgi:hypothetical protein